MAEELRDLRAKISVETDAVLESITRCTGRDRSEIVREVMHAWASRKISEAKVLQDRLIAEGISVPVSGSAGNKGARHG